VGKKDIIALDEDDVVAIVTRRMLDDHPLFRDKTARAGTKSMRPDDRRSFTNIITLYDVLDVVLRTPQKWIDYKRFRPDEADIEKFDRAADAFWDAMTKSFPPLAEIASSAAGDEVAAKYRGEFGGHLLFRPVGLVLVVRAIRALRDELGLYEAILRSSRVQMALDEEPWVRLLWDPVNSRMITAPENQKVAFRLLYHSMGGKLDNLGTTGGELTSEWAGLIGREPLEVELPTPVS
jgi:DNA sulfur modification protein DndB